MKKILSLILAVLMIASVFTAVPVMAEEDVVVLNENYGKVKVTGKVQSNGSIAFGVRSAFGDSETQDVIQYFVSPRGDEDKYGMENNQAFDFVSKQELVSKTSSTVFSDGTKSGGDERTPVSLSGFGWIGAGHGMTCAVNVTGEHGLTYANIGEVYKDINNKEWVLLRVTQVKSGSAMVPSLVFISKNLKSGKNDTNPAFETMTDAHLGTDLVNVNDANNKVTINKYSNSSWLKPAYNMTKQNVYAVNDGVKTLVQAGGSTVEGDYVLVEEEYTIMNPAHVAQAIIDGKPEGGYTENPNLAVGKPLVTFDLEYIYNADGTVISNWETTYHQDVTLGEFGGIQYGMKGDFVYLPGTKPFTMKSSVSLDGGKVEKDSVNFDFSNLFDTTTGYPNGYATIDTWADSSVVPNRRLDFNKSGSSFDKAYAGGQLPVFDGEPTERVNNTDRAFYFWNTRKAYHFSVGGSKADAGINKKYPDMTNATMKGSAYKKWVQDFDANGTSSFYSVPYFSDGDNSRYMYFDIYKPGVTKKYDISAYLGTYSIAQLEKSENLDYDINYETGILTVSSLEKGQTSADFLVLKAKYVGESIPAVELKIRALPELYNESINEKLEEIAEMMENIGADESEYAVDVMAKYNSLLAQKVAYEQALKDEAANAERVAGLDNRYEFIDMKFHYDFFATDNDLKNSNWKVISSAEAPNILAYKGFTNGMTSNIPHAATATKNETANAYKTDKIAQTASISQDKNGNDILTVGGVPFKLGKIARNDGELGANAHVYRSTYLPSLFNDASKLNAFDSAIYGTVEKQNTTGTYPVGKDGVSEVNIISSVNSKTDNSKFLNVKVKYEDEDPITYKYVIGPSKEKFEDSIFVIEKDKFNELKSNDSFTADMVKGSTSGSEPWKRGCKENDEAFLSYYKATKYYQLFNNAEDYPIQKLSALLDVVDLSKLSDRNASTEFYFPVASEQFVPSSLLETNYIHNVKIPVDSSKKIESIAINSDIEHPAASENYKGEVISDYATESGGFYARGTYNVTQGVLMLNYDGKDTVTVGNKEYVLFIDLNRECTESSFFGMTLTNAETWQDKIDALNAKIEALNVETTTKAQLNEIKAEINDLLAQNSSIVYVKDFSEVARTKLDNIEEYLKTHFSEEERLSMLAERTYNYIDFSQQADIDAYITAQDLGDKARFLYNASGTASSVKAPWIEGNEATYTYTPGGATEAKTINLWIPETTSKGTPIQVTDYAYTKGLLQFVSYDADGDGKKESWRRGYPLHVYFMDQLIVDKTAGTNLVMSMEKFKGNKAENTNKQYTEGTFERTTSNIKFTPDNVEKVEQIGDNYYSYVKNGDVMHKIGPMNKTAYSANTLSLSNDAVTDDVVNINATGTRLDLMIAVNDVNANTGNLKNKSEKGLYDAKGVAGTYGGYKAEALTGLQKVIVNYKDGTKETKYLLLRKTQLADSMTYSYYKTGNDVEYSFIYAPKYDEAGNKIVYDGSSVGALGSKFKILNDDNAAADGLYEAGITEVPGVDAVKFENKDIVMAKSGKLARTTQHRMDTADSYYGSEAMIASVLLDSTKEVANVKFERSVDVAKNLGITLTDATNVAILPAEIEGLSDEYVYYAYCGRLGDGNYLMSATLSTAKEDIVKRASEEILNAETAEEAEKAIVESIDNLYTKYRDLSDEAKAHYEAFTKGIGSVRIVPQGAGYKVTAFTDKADKAYKLIICGYDADENLISTKLVDGKTKDSIYYTHLIDSVDENAASVKVFFWEGFKTLLPYAYNVAELK